MQDRYVGDIGDFANNGLLRWLTGMTPQDNKGKLSLGVVQYAHFNELSNGGHIGYLSWTPENEKRFQECDTKLYFALKDLVFKDDRRISAAQQMFEQRGILPPKTIYYDNELSYRPNESCKERKETRDDWLKRAFNATCKAKIVFFNPDNGIADQVSPTSKKDTKYVFMDDLKCFAENGNSLVIYHHFDRSKKEEKAGEGEKGEKADKQIQRISKRLKTDLNRHVRILKWNRWSARFYFIVAQQSHKYVIENRLESFRTSKWCCGPKPHFTLYDQNGKPL